MQIAPGVHNILTGLQHPTGVTNTYLVHGTAAAAFIDTGWDRPGEAQARIDYWNLLGRPTLAAIVVTHRHPPHWGNAPAIQRAGGDAPIIATAAEKPEIERRMQGARVDRTVADGETLDLGGITLEFVHAPGHTYGSLAVFVRETRALFTGDTVMGSGSSVINPGEGEIGLYLRTLEKFLRYDPTVIYPGQGPVVTDPRARLNALIVHRHERSRQIVALLATAPLTVEAIAQALYADVAQGVQHLARRQVESHLLELERQGRVRHAGDTYQLTHAPPP
jgi:glyoxylase-like metal-dependent hydrolase (beta-lactamase superfamily II)